VAANEERPIFSRNSFRCGWSSRAEVALDVAHRVIALNQGLAKMEPAHHELWPLFAARAIRPGRDPGPISDMSVDELAELIDRRARFDPPRWPAPVSDGGYNLVMSANLRGTDLLSVGVWVRAGAYPDSPPTDPNDADLDFHVKNPIWMDFDRGLQALHLLIDSMEPDWACASNWVGDEKGHHQPWLAWAAQDRTIPDFYIGRASPPSEVRADRGGRLYLWRGAPP
jgi:hypothetical protein